MYPGHHHPDQDIEHFQHTLPGLALPKGKHYFCCHGLVSCGKRFKLNVYLCNMLVLRNYNFSKAPKCLAQIEKNKVRSLILSLPTTLLSLLRQEGMLIHEVNSYLITHVKTFLPLCESELLVVSYSTMIQAKNKVMEDGRKPKLRKETGIVVEVLPSPVASGFGAAATTGWVWLTLCSHPCCYCE